MSKESSVPTNGFFQPHGNVVSTFQTSTASASSATPSTLTSPSTVMNADATFLEVYNCAKLNQNWEKVSGALIAHPEWLTRIPDGRAWSILHQIVFSGHVVHLNEVLALQTTNPQFRLLFTARDGKTVRDVAQERAHLHSNMARRIERLIATDELLNNAKDRKWDLVKECIRAQPDIVNEKPPYRRYFLAHHLAYVGQLEIFKELSKICHFKLDLIADNKTISQVAREHNKIAFAEYVESLETASNDTAAGTTTQASSASSSSSSTAAAAATGNTQIYSPAFYDEPCISFIPANLNLNNIFPLSSHASSYSNSHHHNTHSTYNNYQPANHQYFATHSLYQADNPTVGQNHHQENATYQSNQNDHKKSVKPKPNTSKMTDDEQTAYEQTVISNASNMSEQSLLNSITCCITKTILRDPVVAADGFTYEREAITKWFENSNRSPMTNQELESLELKPNYAIKSILQALQGSTSLTSKSDKK